MKNQTEFTFDEAKDAAIKRLSVLASFAENLHDEVLDEAFLAWAITLRTIEAKVRKASRRCLSDFEIEQIGDLRARSKLSDLHFGSNYEVFRAEFCFFDPEGYLQVLNAWYFCDIVT